MEELPECTAAPIDRKINRKLFGHGNFDQR